MDFVLIDTIADQGIDLSQTTPCDMRRLARENAHLLRDAYTALGRLVAWAEHGGAWPSITSDHPAYFYTLRAAGHRRSSAQTAFGLSGSVAHGGEDALDGVGGPDVFPMFSWEVVERQQHVAIFG